MINGSLPDARDDIGRYSVCRGLRCESKATLIRRTDQIDFVRTHVVVISLGLKSIIYSTKLKKSVYKYATRN